MNKNDKMIKRTSVKYSNRIYIKKLKSIQRIFEEQRKNTEEANV